MSTHTPYARYDTSRYDRTGVRYDYTQTTPDAVASLVVQVGQAPLLVQVGTAAIDEQEAPVPLEVQRG